MNLQKNYICLLGSALLLSFLANTNSTPAYGDFSCYSLWDPHYGFAPLTVSVTGLFAALSYEYYGVGGSVAFYISIDGKESFYYTAPLEGLGDLDAFAPDTTVTITEPGQHEVKARCQYSGGEIAESSPTMISVKSNEGYDVGGTDLPEEEEFSEEEFAEDSDGDSFYDDEDLCPFDPEDFIGIEDGCPEEEFYETEEEEFDFDIAVESQKISMFQGEKRSIKAILSLSGTPKPVKLSMFGVSDNKILGETTVTPPTESQWDFDTNCNFPPSLFFYAFRAEGGGISKTSEEFSIEIKPNPDCLSAVTQPQEEPSEPFDFIILPGYDIEENSERVIRAGNDNYYTFGVRQLTEGQPETVTVALGGPGIFDLVQNNKADWHFFGLKQLDLTPDFNGILTIKTKPETEPGEYKLEIVAASKKVKRTLPIILNVEKFTGIYDPAESDEYYPLVSGITSVKLTSPLPKVVGKFDLVAGDVSIKGPNDSDWRRAYEGNPLRNGDLIKTDKGGVILILDNYPNSPIRLAENGKYIVGSLGELIQDPGLSFIDIVAGEIRYQSLSQKDEHFIISTPAAVIRTEGTDIIVKYDDFASLTSVDIKEGQVTVMPTFTGKATKYEAGQTIATSINGLTTTMPLDEGRWEILVSDFALAEKETGEQQSMQAPVSEEKGGGCLIATAT